MSVTIQQIAEKAGVSRGTVDRALNNRGRINPEVAEMVKRTAEEMGYVHKARKRQKSAGGKKKIGIVTQLSGSSFMLEVKRGIQTGKKELEELGGKRQKFPAKGSTHQGRWCSGTLKASVQDSVTANLLETKHAKLLIVSGERRGESPGRSHYNEMEVHRTNTRSRLVHQWRNVIDWSERDIWECMKRHNINPHPCYRAGWNRCSCAMCIFSTPTLFAGIKELYPEEYEALVQDEKILGFTLDNKCDLNTFVGDAKSCVVHKDHDAVQSLLTGQYTPEQIYVKGEWNYPAGAFHGAAGGPC